MAVHRAALAHHTARITGCAIALIAAPRALLPLIAIAQYFAIFMLAHELVHAALGLPRRLNEALLAIVGAAIANSGHALRVMHLRPHARPFAEGDLEVSAAHLSPARALAASPRLYGQLL